MGAPLPRLAGARYLLGLLALPPGCRHGALPFGSGRHGRRLQGTRAGGPPPRKALGVLRPPRRPLCETRRKQAQRGHFPGRGGDGRAARAPGLTAGLPAHTQQATASRGVAASKRQFWSPMGDTAGRNGRRTSLEQGERSGGALGVRKVNTHPALRALLSMQLRSPFPFPGDGVPGVRAPSPSLTLQRRRAFTQEVPERGLCKRAGPSCLLGSEQRCTDPKRVSQMDLFPANQGQLQGLYCTGQTSGRVSGSELPDYHGSSATDGPHSTRSTRSHLCPLRVFTKPPSFKDASYSQVPLTDDVNSNCSVPPTCGANEESGYLVNAIYGKQRA